MHINVRDIEPQTGILVGIGGSVAGDLLENSRPRDRPFAGIDPPTVGRFALHFGACSPVALPACRSFFC
jgi:hypothetical protein